MSVSLIPVNPETAEPIQPAVTVPRLFAVPEKVAFSANVVVPVAPTVIAGEASDPCRTKLSAEDFIIKFAISYPLLL